jgi:hypothetical protein
MQTSLQLKSTKYFYIMVLELQLEPLKSLETFKTIVNGCINLLFFKDFRVHFMLMGQYDAKNKQSLV